MHDDYFSFLDYRAARRRLVKKFARPRWLLANLIAFVATMTGIWLYGTVWGLWRWEVNLQVPVFIGVVWSMSLALMALVLYRRSAAQRDRREEIIEDEMYGLIEQSVEPINHQQLFIIHQQFEAEFEQESQWFIALTIFAVINALSWLISAQMSIGSSWPFQTTLPFALFIVGGGKVFLAWQQQRREPDRQGWFVRLPLRHFAVYVFSCVALALAGGLRLVNRPDVDTVIVWWMLLLLVQTGWKVIVEPLFVRLMGKAKLVEPIEKPKHIERLVLGDDGELIVSDEYELPEQYSYDLPHDVAEDTHAPQ